MLFVHFIGIVPAWHQCQCSACILLIWAQTRSTINIRERCPPTIKTTLNLLYPISRDDWLIISYYQPLSYSFLDLNMLSVQDSFHDSCGYVCEGKKPTHVITIISANDQMVISHKDINYRLNSEKSKKLIKGRAQGRLVDTLNQALKTNTCHTLTVYGSPRLSPSSILNHKTPLVFFFFVTLNIKC